MEKKIILTTKGNISGSDKQSLRRSGVIIAEVKNINEIKIISGMDFFDIDDISLCAIEVIMNYAHSDKPKSEFAEKLLRRIVIKQKGCIDKTILQKEK